MSSSDNESRASATPAPQFPSRQRLKELTIPSVEAWRAVFALHDNDEQLHELRACLVAFAEMLFQHHVKPAAPTTPAALPDLGVAALLHKLTRGDERKMMMSSGQVICCIPQEELEAALRTRGAAPQSEEAPKLEGNWHEISGPNGMCECGTEKGGCPERLAAFLRRAVDYWGAIAKFTQRERDRALEELPDHFSRLPGSLAERIKAYREFNNKCHTELRLAAAPARLRELAREAAREKHHTDYRFGGNSGHVCKDDKDEGFSTCPHPDCQLVRGGAQEGEP